MPIAMGQDLSPVFVAAFVEEWANSTKAATEACRPSV